MNRNKRKIMTAGLLFVLLGFTGFAGMACGAEPRADDVERIKKEFLTFRFRAPLDERFADKSDLELFRLICAENRVRCGPVLEMLKESDPEFHEKLHE
ncbi:MAG: hypothetical protein NXI24_16215 [bacterium]|nr:hypothetical protein [bacterium]